MTIHIGKYISIIAPTFIVACAFSSVCSAGEYYKWVDDKGITHFSERPTQTTGVEKIQTSARQPTTEEKAKPEEITAAVNPAPTPQAQFDQKRCTDSQERLKSLGSGSRIRMDDGKGGFYYLDQQQVTQEVQKTHAAIAESCKK
jgi:hypothetical protein